MSGHQEFSYGVTPAIQFDTTMDRLPDPRGDCVKITMSGKFLLFRLFGNSDNVPEYWYMEEWGRLCGQYFSIWRVEWLLAVQVLPTSSFCLLVPATDALFRNAVLRWRSMRR